MIHSVAQTLYDNRYTCISHNEMTQFFRLARKVCFVVSAFLAFTLHIEKAATLFCIGVVLDMTLKVDERRAWETQVIQRNLTNRANAVGQTLQQVTTAVNQIQQETGAISERNGSLSETTSSDRQAAQQTLFLAEQLKKLVSAYGEVMNQIVTHSTHFSGSPPPSV